MLFLRFACALTVGALIALGGGATASAAMPFTAGSGSDPDVAVAPDGTGHVVWTTPRPSTVGYCRVPKDGIRCEHTVSLAFPGAGPAQQRAAVVYAPSATKVVIVAGCWNCGAGSVTDRVYRWISNDRGTTFGGPVEIQPPGSVGFDFSKGHGLWIDGSELFVGVAGAFVSAMPNSAQRFQFSPFPVNYTPEIARVPGSDKLVAVTDDLAAIRYRVYRGPLAPEAISAEANWSPPLPVDAVAKESGVSSGTSGLFLHYFTITGGGPRVVVRKFDPASDTFGPPSEAAGLRQADRNGLDQPDTTVDAEGRVHAVWRNLSRGGQLRWGVSVRTDGTGGFAGPATLANETPVQPRVAAARRSGFVVWNTLRGDVRVVPLDWSLLPESVGGRPKTRTKSARVSGGTVKLTSPAACVQPGERFTLSLTGRKSKGKNNPFVRVQKVDFLRAGKVVKTDSKAPFSQKLQVPAGAKEGSTITFGARATIKVSRGKAPRKTINATIRVCA